MVIVKLDLLTCHDVRLKDFVDSPLFDPKCALPGTEVCDDAVSVDTGFFSDFSRTTDKSTDRSAAAEAFVSL